MTTKDKALTLADEYRSTMTREVLHSWAIDAQAELKRLCAAIDEAQAQPAPSHSLTHAEADAIQRMPFVRDCLLRYAARPVDETAIEVVKAIAVQVESLDATTPADEQPAPTSERPTNCGTSICSCIECVMEPELPPLPDERAAFEDLLDAAEEWERFVDVDRAPMNLRKWLERAALAQRSAEQGEVRALREENARLRGECVEWLCARCQTIHPSQRGRTFLQPCPECGEAMEPTSFNIRALKRMDALTEAARLGLEALKRSRPKEWGSSAQVAHDAAIARLSAALPAHQKEGGQHG